MNPLTYISLFSSAGVGCYAFKQLGFECVATNELLERRMNIQKYNKKCIRLEGYICGDLCDESTKNRIMSEVGWWKKNRGMKCIDVIIATPPCQGMSVFNHKKKESDIHRNSLVLESIDMIDSLKPKMFIFENVPSFLKTLCICKEDSKRTIGEAIEERLGSGYSIMSDVINFKNYGSNSSRTRSLVIGVRKDLAGFVSPVELFPQYNDERVLSDVIGNLNRLDAMGGFDEGDFYHNFKPYPEYMLEWIVNLGEGQSAFDNEDERARPYKIDKDGALIPNANKNGGKYCRLYWDKVAPAIHTRNDQLASQNTIHPSDNRVLSIRELMLLMTIPKTFQWMPLSFNTANNLPAQEKAELLKKHEMTIRQSIGEAVPTQVFYSIGKKIKEALSHKNLSDKELRLFIEDRGLKDIDKLKEFIDTDNELSVYSLSRLVELANASRVENSGYFTQKETLRRIFSNLPEINREPIQILEPSVGMGNFLPFIIAKYGHAKELLIDVVDIDPNMLACLKTIVKKVDIPNNVKIKYVNHDFIEWQAEKRYDLVVGNPPFFRIKNSGDKLKKYRQSLGLESCNNIASFFVEKCRRLGNNVALVLPKNFLNGSEYSEPREGLSKHSVTKIIDFGERAFKDIGAETICIFVDTEKKPGRTTVESVPRKATLTQKQEYIFDRKLPNWVIYRNEEFDAILDRMIMNAFSVYRDRFLSKKNTHVQGDVWVIQARNMLRDGTLQHIKGYDKFINLSKISNASVLKYLNDESVFIAPNMTYYPRAVRKPANTVCNGTVAILIPRDGRLIAQSDIDFIGSDEFEQFYRIAMNHATRTLNIDSASVFYYCVHRN